MSLSDYVSAWEENYQQKVGRLPLFDPALTRQWTMAQRQFFVKAFYHIRGHCNDFFWFVANHTSDIRVKEIILENTREEYGKDLLSHEQLFYQFAEAMGCNMHEEVVNQTTNLPFIQAFNTGHLRWLAQHDSDAQFAAFSAYEKLDNPDYTHLYALAESFGLDKKPLTFFYVHTFVEHFEETSPILEEIWNRSPESVKAAFDFIGDHQYAVWKQLGEAVYKVPAAAIAY